MQTPQGFRFKSLLSAYLLAESDGFTATDDASVMEHAGMTVRLVQGSHFNIKITHKEDLTLMKAILQQSSLPLRTGSGYDVHRFTAG